MNNNTLTIRTVFGVVLAWILSALFVGWLVMVIGLSTTETPSKSYTFLSVIIGQGFMLVPLLGFLKLRNEPIVERLRLYPVSNKIVLSAISGNTKVLDQRRFRASQSCNQHQVTANGYQQVSFIPHVTTHQF